MKYVFLLLATILLFFNAVSVCQAQHVIFLAVVAQAQEGCTLIDKSKAFHFISFERLSGKNNSDVQLRLINNSTCTIVLDTWEDPPKRPIAEIIKDSGVCKPSMFLELQDGQHVGMFYNIHFSGRNLTQHFGAGDAITAATLKGGRSILFDVPRKHFKNGGDLKIRFEYDWQVCHVAQDRYVVIGAEISFFSWFLPKEVLR